MTCEDCLYKKVCADFGNQGCIDADCCSDFESKADYVHLKRHIGDMFYEAVANQVTTYRISQIELKSDGNICYLLDTVDGKASVRHCILESEVDDVCLSYQDALNDIRENRECTECIHHEVCKLADNITPHRVQKCKDYVKSANTTIYPCSVGQEFYVVQPAARKLGMDVADPITKYVVAHIHICQYSSFSDSDIVLRDKFNNYLSVRNFSQFEQLVGRVFFYTKEAAEFELRSCTL